MSDKDESVEMSVEITADDSPAVESTEVSSTSSPEPANNLPTTTDDKLTVSLPEATDSLPSCENEVSDEMGQMKSKIKKLREKKIESEEDENEDVEIELDNGDDSFLCGVVEGFYGRPWTTAQRKELFRRMQSMGMNTYLYGPKDDYKHRLCWRDLYSDDETALMKVLIDSAADHDILFIYAISPGLDMSFASDKEIDFLKNKLLQVQSLGCKAFALLFDDIDPILRAPDIIQFASAASAQADVTNQMFDLLGKPKFLFCPTEYCNSMACPDVSNSKYLKTIGKELNRNISIMWTGPKVVSKCITVESIQELTRIVCRKVVIWDNIHANDYDPKRIFLGPYKGRSTDLIPNLAGVLTNPNCEFESNFIAMHTLSSWWKCHGKQTEVRGTPVVDNQEKKSDVEMKSEGKKADSEGVEKGLTESEKKTEEIKQEQKQDKNEKEKDGMKENVGKENETLKTSPKETRESTLTESTVKTAGNVPNASPMSSASSSLTGSDSDTDSDYSSHDEFYVLRRPFDHGAYNPDESLKEAIKFWLPYFSASCLPLGKPIPRSGPPLGMVSQCDVSLMSNAPMGPTSSTTSALSSDPISSTPFKYGSPGHTPNIEIKTETKDNPVTSESADIEMAGATPSSITQASGGASELSLDENPPADLDIDMKSVQEREKDENMQTGDVVEVDVTKEIEPTVQIEEMEDEEAMQYEGDRDSDVSMATNNSGDKGRKEDTKEFDGRNRSVSGSSVEMASPPHQPLSSPEQNLDSTHEHGVDIENEPSIFKMDQMMLEDIELAVQLFYLPYEHGGAGKMMVQEFVWLQCNVRLASETRNSTVKAEKTEIPDKALEWMERALQFEDSCMSIRRMCYKLTSCSNRALLYDLFPYFWDMNGVVSMLSSYVKWMGQFYLRHTTVKTSAETASSTSKPNSPGSTSKPTSPAANSSVLYSPPTGPWLGPDPESWLFKGGLSGELQRLLPVTMANDLFYQVIPCVPHTSNSTYIIRPYLPTDEKSVYKICLSTGNDGTDFADDFTGYDDLPGERLVGGLLTLCPEYCFVVEDEQGICGYLVGVANAQEFWKKYSIAFLPEVKETYSIQKEEERERKTGVKLGEEVRRLLGEIRSDDLPDSYAVDNLYTTHPAYMQIAVHRRAADPSIAKSMTVCMLSALKSHGVHGVHTTVRSSDCYLPDLYSRLGFHEIRPLDPLPVTPPPSSSTYNDDTFIVFGRSF